MNGKSLAQQTKFRARESMIRARGLMICARGSMIRARGLMICARGSMIRARGLMICARGSMICARESMSCDRGLMSCDRESMSCARGLMSCDRGSMSLRPRIDELRPRIDGLRAPNDKNNHELNKQNMEELILELKQEIINVLNLEGMTPDQIADGDELFGEGLGLDSIDALELIVLLERNYGIKLKDPSEGKTIFRSIRTMAEYVTANRTK
jgi:acyl carrier protein